MDTDERQIRSRAIPDILHAGRLIDALHPAQQELKLIIFTTHVGLIMHVQRHHYCLCLFRSSIAPCAALNSRWQAPEAGLT